MINKVATQVPKDVRSLWDPVMKQFRLRDAQIGLGPCDVIKQVHHLMMRRHFAGNKSAKAQREGDGRDYESTDARIHESIQSEELLCHGVVFDETYIFAMKPHETCSKKSATDSE